MENAYDDPGARGELARLGRALRATLDTSRQALDRIDSVMRSLRRFVRLDEAELQYVDVVECIESALTLLGPSPDGKHVERQLEPVPQLWAAPAPLNQAFTTLLLNAIEAVDPGGVVRVRCWAEADQVLVQVADDGPGIPEQERARLFEVGWSRRGARVKLRLGLSAVAATVAQLGGSIDVETDKGRGASFTVRLPVSAAPTGAAPVRAGQ